MALSLKAQENEIYEVIPLENLDSFRSPGSNWAIAGQVESEWEKDKTLVTKSGTGILVNLPEKDQQSNLTFNLEHGDIDLEFEFMMAKNSNSGVYLQGRYEIQLLDSWGKRYPSFGDCGGIYQRWDESRPEGNFGYEGYAPRINASRAPGLWQKMEISFQAPRFDASGKKIGNAKIISIRLNGEEIHNNVELTGPTRGPAFPGETAKGPLFIQGDHGPVAFRNIKYRAYEPVTIKPRDISYSVYEGEFNEMPDLSKLNPVQTGTTPGITHEFVSLNEKFLLNLKGKIDLPATGKYNFLLQSNGVGLMNIDGEEVVAMGQWAHGGDIALEAGEHEFEIYYYKPYSWVTNGLGLLVEGPGFRRMPLHIRSSMPLSNPVNPIKFDVGNEPRITRAFVDYPGPGAQRERRIVHAISVGYPEGIHYVYDPDRAALAIAWKGEFLDATPMLNSRGDGSVRPGGNKLLLGDETNLAVLLGGQEAWPAAPSDALGYRFRGYIINNQGSPVFQYTVGNSLISDWIKPKENGKYWERTITAEEGINTPLKYRLATGHTIEKIESSRYMIDGSYFIVLTEGNATLRQQGEHQELIASLDSKGKSTSITYQIIW